MSSQALAMLRELHDIRSSRNYVFPSTRGSEDRPIAKGTLNQAAKTLGLEGEHFVLHDFRRTGLSHLRDVLQSADGKNAFAEAKDTVAVREMQLWADYVDAQVGEQASSPMGVR
jgi:integrase